MIAGIQRREPPRFSCCVGGFTGPCSPVARGYTLLRTPYSTLSVKPKAIHECDSRLPVDCQAESRYLIWHSSHGYCPSVRCRQAAFQEWPGDANAHYRSILKQRQQSHQMHTER
jgi:hypothetical protein